MNIQFRDQQCNVAGLALSWIGYVAGLGYFSYQRQWIAALFLMVVVPSLRWALFHFFSHISRFLGYGRIVDNVAPIPPPHKNPRIASVVVNFYSFFSCPFCPIVLARLQALQKQTGFILKTFDASLSPRTLMRKGIRSVPVVEVDHHRLVGNSTTEQLAGLIALGQATKLLQAS
jgi:hypothetical protein